MKMKNKKKTSLNDFSLEDINSRTNGQDNLSSNFGNLDILNPSHGLKDIKHISSISPRINHYKY